MTARILLIEDDESIRTSLSMFLVQEGYSVDEAADGEQALVAFGRGDADMVLVDLMLPGIDGFEVIRRLRRTSDVPIVIVTARDDSYDLVAGLEAGADDYVTKPVVAKELSARIRALLRRSSAEHAPAVLRFGGLEIEPQTAVVRRDGDEVTLTRSEFQLLCALAARPGWVLSRAQLLERVWEYDYRGDTRLVDVHVRRLRAKIERVPSRPEWILTVRGIGYKLQP
ncbi:MAG: response regulator transcription factor [Acidimicrobiales bacterium]